MVKAILFDFWGTLIENGVYPSPVRQVKYILRLDIPFQDFITTFENSFMVEELENLTVGFQKVCKDFNISPPEFVVDKLIGMWNKNTLLAKPFEETVEVLEKLKKKHKLALIANTDPFSVEAVVKKFDLEKYFDAVALSYKTKMLKTNPKMFKELLKQLKVKEKDCLMVGDSMESDIKAAENAGIKSVLVDRRDRREFENKIINLKELDKILKK